MITKLQFTKLPMSFARYPWCGRQQTFKQSFTSRTSDQLHAPCHILMFLWLWDYCR